MKNHKLAALCMVLSLGAFSVLQAEEEGWIRYHQTSGGALYYEPKSIMIEENVVEVWSKFLPTGEGEIREMKHHVRFDCSRRKVKILNSNTYYRNGSLIELAQKSSFEPVEPGSTSEILFNSVCTHQEEGSSLPTGTTPAL